MNRIKNITKRILSKDWAKLYRIEYDYKFKNGLWKRIERETYDRGNGVCVLLFNPEQNTVLLTRQFRMPIYANVREEAMSIEVCAGAMDREESPKDCMIREIEEEVGYHIPEIQQVMEAYSTPGAVTEKMYLFTAAYNASMKVSNGGGVEDEQEEIEVLEYAFSEALAMIVNGQIKDAKTIILLQYAQIKGLLKSN